MFECLKGLLRSTSAVTMTHGLTHEAEEELDALAAAVRRMDKTIRELESLARNGPGGTEAAGLPKDSAGTEAPTDGEEILHGILKALDQESTK